MNDPRHPPFITVSLKDALKQRPESKQPLHHVRAVLDKIDRLAAQKGRSLTIVTGNGRSAPAERKYYGGSTPTVICTPMWRPEDFRTFDNLTAMSCSPSAVDQAMAEDLIRQFVRKHGVDKCDMMLAEIRRRDAQVWFSKTKVEGA